MIAPQIVPRMGVAAAFASTPRRAEPASAFRPSVITAMPKRKRPTPPRMEIIVAKTYPPTGHHCINVPIVRNHREPAGVWLRYFSNFDWAKAAHLLGLVHVGCRSPGS